ncbi:MAG: toprim domain-containing protein [Phycisphaerales bacterium]|nr:toprim domain-containing protein [Phycisphaerales bacterium]
MSDQARPGGHDDLRDRILERLASGGHEAMVHVVRWLGYNGVHEGPEYKILCPFHSDSTPSLCINGHRDKAPDGRGMFKCFACGWGGDVFRFVQEAGKVDFRGSLKLLAEILGLGESKHSPPTSSSTPDPNTASGGDRVPPGAFDAPADRVQDETDDASEKYKADGIEKAKKLWARASADHPRVEAYLKARGIDVARLANGLIPKSLRFASDVDDTCIPLEKGGQRRHVRHPAMIAEICEFAKVDGQWRRNITGVHRTFLDVKGEPKKRDPGWGSSKKMLGDCTGRAVQLSRTTPSGVLILAEGIETALACMTPTSMAAWACLDADKMADVVVPKGLVRPDGKAAVHTIIIAADFDPGVLVGKHRENFITRQRARMPWIDAATLDLIAAKPTGERAAWRLKVRLERDLPHVAVYVRAPGPESCPQAFTFEAGDQVEVDPAAPASKPVPKLKEGTKKLDWLDVVLLAGHESAREGLLGGIDLEGNKARAAAWLPPPEWSWDDLSVQPRANAGGSTPAGGGGSGGSGNGDKAGSKGAGQNDGGGKSTATAGGGAKGPDADGFVELDSGERRRLMGTEDLTLARMFIDEHYAPAEKITDRANSRPTIIALVMEETQRGRGFQRFDGARWRDLSDAEVQAQIRRWLTPCARAKVHKDGDIEYVPYNPAMTKVRAIMHAIADEVLVSTDNTRFWSHPIYDSRGMARWVRRSHEIEVDDPVAAGRLKPDEVLGFLDYQLSIPDLLKKKLVVWKPTPLLCQRTCFPYKLPVDELRIAVERNEVADWEALYRKYCPTWSGTFLPGLRWTPGEYNLLQVFFGYVQQPITKYKQGNIAILHGGGDSGKTCVEEALQNAIGRENVVDTSPAKLADEFHLASFEHKLLAKMSESESGKFTDNPEAVRVLKQLGDGNTMNLRKLFQNPRTNVRLFVRFLISVNKMPDWKDDTGALLNRIIVFDFRKLRGTLDRGIKERIITQEGLGLVLWGLEGQLLAHELRENGVDPFSQPAASASPLNVYAEYSTPLKGFVDQFIELCDEEEIWDPDANQNVRRMPFLTSEEIHEAWCVSMNRWPPEPSQRAKINRAIFTAIRHAGWTGEYSQPTVGGQRSSGYTKLRMTGSGRQAVDEFKRRMNSGGSGSSGLYSAPDPDASY